MFTSILVTPIQNYYFNNDALRNLGHTENIQCRKNNSNTNKLKLVIPYNITQTKSCITNPSHAIKIPT